TFLVLHTSNQIVDLSAEAQQGATRHLCRISSDVKLEATSRLQEQISRGLGRAEWVRCSK
ncbi:hypothetical protein PoB_002777100, partial [Plakobranchus ocellatus]